MSEVVERYINIVNPFISAAYYRTLGINSIHIPLDEMVDFINAPDNPFGGEVTVYWKGQAYNILKWDNINLSRRGVPNPVTFNAWLFGGGTNTVGVRERFYEMHLVRGAVERALGLERYALRLLKR